MTSLDLPDIVQNVYLATIELFEAGAQKDSITKYLREVMAPEKNPKEKNERNLITLNFPIECSEVVSFPGGRSEQSEDNIMVLNVVEFFTHCCINCIHSIQDIDYVFNKLRKEEAQHLSKVPLNLVSIHSPKFPRERQDESVKLFCEKMGLNDHLVVNDPDCSVWKELGIICWPTVLICYGPRLDSIRKQSYKQYLLFELIGEGQRDNLLKILTSSLSFLSELGVSSGVNKPFIEWHQPDVTDGRKSVYNGLSYPGKITILDNIIAISDSGHNQVVLCDNRGVIKGVVGNGKKDFKDGDFQSCSFNNPHGLCFRNEDTLYVADTGNHALRCIEIKNQKVTTLIDSEYCIKKGEDGSMTKLKSPWDIIFYDDNKDVLLVAAAGSHQLFGYFYKDYVLFNVRHSKDTIHLIAGTGKEENRNNSYILKSSFAQPSGLSVGMFGTEPERYIFIADSESSSIRCINGVGRVSGFVGGTRDPTNLFSFGDVDGCSFDVKLQHPMAVCCGQSKVFVADTFNNKVKMINFETKHCTTLIGDGQSGDELGAFTGYLTPKRLGLSSSPSRDNPENSTNQVGKPIARLNEPGGMVLDKKNQVLYIADTNNKKIKIADLNTLSVSELSLSSDRGQPSKEPLATFKVCHNALLSFELNNLPNNFDAGVWYLKTNKEVKSGELDRNGLIQLDPICVPNEMETESVELTVILYLCGETGCYKKSMYFELVIARSAEGISSICYDL